YEPPPLRITLKPGAVPVGRWETDPAIECTVFDFGGISIRYRIPVDDALDALPRLSDSLYENWSLLDDSRRRVEEICRAIAAAIGQHAVAPLVEDYVVFSVERWHGGGSIDDLVTAHAQELAQILSAETGPISAQQARDLVDSRVSFGGSDAVLASWASAIVFDDEPADVLTVLEHVNVELAEMRLLDRTLDELLEKAYALLQRRARRSLWPKAPGRVGLRSIAVTQMDAAMLFESVNNAIKLVGDQFLARVYNLAASRVHLSEWDAAILRKLDTAESIYQKLSQHETGRRMEILEIIIVVLIAVSIVMTFVPGGGH
ncbi:MAG TPA: hypothetical protein VFF69_06350, partial [Phycisphaerales bacterium]|nr:hypothetical protein [Phycisphaerales bacterium]